MARLSTLQKSILLQCLDRKGRLNKKGVEQWYAQMGKERAMRYRDAQHTITNTLENLINKGYLVGYGIRTSQKWFIHEVRLTPQGRQRAKRLQGIQQELPLQNSKYEARNSKKI